MQIERIEEEHLTTSDEAAINALMVRAFNETFGGRSFYQQRHHTRFVIRHGDAIIGHMALCCRSIRLGQMLVKIIGLAEVATDPDHQGKGLASAMMSETLQEARASTADFYLLFGDRPIYAGNGFRTVPNSVTYVDLSDAWTGQVSDLTDTALMMLELTDRKWDDEAHVDLLGNMF